MLLEELLVSFSDVLVRLWSSPLVYAHARDTREDYQETQQELDLHGDSSESRRAEEKRRAGAMHRASANSGGRQTPNNNTELSLPSEIRQLINSENCEKKAGE